MSVNALRELLTGPALTTQMRRRRTNKFRLAKAAGVSYVTLWLWETNKVEPSDELLLRVGRAIGLV